MTNKRKKVMTDGENQRKSDMAPGSLLTYRQAIKILNCSMRAFYNILERGDLPVIKLGGMRRVDAQDLQQLIDRSKTTCLKEDAAEDTKELAVN